MTSQPKQSSSPKGGSFLIEAIAPEDIFIPEDISEEQRMFARAAEEFLRKEVIPREDAIYAKDYAVHRELMQKAGELGLLSIDIPEKYGGLGLHKVSSAVVGEQFALQASFAGTQSSHVNIGTLPIVFFGTEEQKRKYLPKLASGEWIGRHYVLNGQKMWITNGGFADLFTVFAKVDGEKFTAFLVERGPGLVSGHEEKKLGIDGSSTTALMLEDCYVPVENVLGEIGRGHKIAFNVLNIGRLKLGARSVGTIKLSLQQSVQYAKERHQFGQPIANFGLIKHKLAEMTIRAFVGESILYRTLGTIDDALEQADKDDPAQVLRVLEQFAIECSIIKVWESEALGYVVDEEVQVFGGYGYSKDYPASDELLLVQAAKSMTLASIGAANQAYGNAARHEQEVIAHIADMVMDVYAMESALLRTQRLLTDRGIENSRVQADITRVFARDAASHVERAARAVASETEDEKCEAAIDELWHSSPMKSIAARRRIADAVIHAGRYFLS